jgi:pullulanase/glycogen debranching enzyme
VVSALRAAHRVFRRRRFFTGRPVRQRGSAGLPDIAWLTPDGAEMTEDDWESGHAKSVAVFLNGEGVPDLDARGQRVVDNSFLLCFNAHQEPVVFVVPSRYFEAGTDISSRVAPGLPSSTPQIPRRTASVDCKNRVADEGPGVWQLESTLTTCVTIFRSMTTPTFERRFQRC